MLWILCIIILVIVLSQGRKANDSYSSVYSVVDKTLREYQFAEGKKVLLHDPVHLAHVIKELRVDNENCQVAFIDNFNKTIKVVKTSEITECQLIENNNLILKSGTVECYPNGDNQVSSPNNRRVTKNLSIKIGNFDGEIFDFIIISYEVEHYRKQYKDSLKFAYSVFSEIVSLSNLVMPNIK